jgi:hypothetical protein
MVSSVAMDSQIWLALAIAPMAFCSWVATVSTANVKLTLAKRRRGLLAFRVRKFLLSSTSVLRDAIAEATGTAFFDDDAG